MRLIAAVDRRWGIGNKGELLVRIPQDHKMFRSLTIGGVVLGGRRTMEGLPGKKPLPGRTNLLLTRRQDYSYPGAVIVHSVPEALAELEKYPSDRSYIIGGGEVYQEFLPYCDMAFITKIDHLFEADTFFPDLDRDPEWQEIQADGRQRYCHLEYRFTIYERSFARSVRKGDQDGYREKAGITVGVPDHKKRAGKALRSGAGYDGEGEGRSSQKDPGKDREWQKTDSERDGLSKGA